MAKTVRMADIAQKLGISVVSVSKGLAGKDGVSEEMRARIVAAAKELGYTPAVRSEPAPRASANIGILVADRFFNENAFYSALYRALLKSASEAGCGGSADTGTADTGAASSGSAAADSGDTAPAGELTVPKINGDQLGRRLSGRDRHHQDPDQPYRHRRYHLCRLRQAVPGAVPQHHR